MRNVYVRSWQEADTYLAGGQKKYRRPIASYLHLERVDHNDPDGPIAIQAANKPDYRPVIFYKDGSVQINKVGWTMWGNRIINQYSGTNISVYIKQFKLLYWMPGMGRTPVRQRKCKFCTTGQIDIQCDGPPMCREVGQIPKHLLETGAPGAHCSHYETTYHYVNKCQHDVTHSHVAGTRDCWRCNASGQINIGGIIKGEPWPSDSFIIKNGVIV
jgi:hypothetical protein